MPDRPCPECLHPKMQLMETPASPYVDYLKCEHCGHIRAEMKPGFEPDLPPTTPESPAN